MQKSKNIHIILSVSIGLALAIMLYYTISGIVMFYNLMQKYPDTDFWEGMRSYIMTLIPEIAGMIGLIIFITSKFKRHGLLRIYLCFSIIGTFTYITYMYGFFTYRKTGPLHIIFIFNLVIHVIFIIACIIGVWILSRTRKLKLNYVQGAFETVAEFAPASAGKRLANYVIDYTIMLYSLWEFLHALMETERLNPDFHYFSSRNSGFPYWIYLWPIFYYLLFEGLFKTTAGKSATNTIVVNERGETPGFGQLLGRSICRYIPFDAFSYLGKSARGWHDTLTDTYVVSSVESDFEGDEEKSVTEFLSRETEV